MGYFLANNNQMKHSAPGFVPKDAKNPRAMLNVEGENRVFPEDVGDELKILKGKLGENEKSRSNVEMCVTNFLQLTKNLIFEQSLQLGKWH